MNINAPHASPKKQKSFKISQFSARNYAFCGTFAELTKKEGFTNFFEFIY